MKLFKRGVVVAAMAAGAVALTGGVASAAISPDPYSTTTGSGRFATTSIAGNSSCNLTGVNANGTGNANGASGTITAFGVSGCSGIVLAGRFSRTINWDVNRGTVTLNRAFMLITNILGGTCLYEGTLAGTIDRNGGNIISARGTMTLLARLAGTCTASADATLTATLAGGAISW